MHETGLDHDFFRRQSPLDKFPACELRARDVAVHLVLPSSQGALARDHQGDSGARANGVFIAAVPEAADQGVLHAFFADVALTEQVPRRAEEPVVVQRLYYRNTSFRASVVCRRGNEWHRIVEMCYIGPFARQQGTKLAVGSGRPEGCRAQTNPAAQAVERNLAAVPGVLDNPVSGGGQEVALLVDARVFAARLLIVVMNEQNHHWMSKQDRV